MRRYVVLAILPILMLLAGCALFQGVPAPKTTAEQIGAANATVTALAQTVDDSVKSGAMSPDTAQKAHDALQQASGALDLASSALTRGNTSTALGQLQIAQTILVAIQSQVNAALKAQGGKQ